jgi:glycerol kinase
MAMLIAIDAGTTGIRALAVDAAASITEISYRELTQSFPSPGWVEHDPAEIWSLVIETLNEVAALLHARGETVAAIGITNQRETTVAWDRTSGAALAPAIVWQDQRTAARCATLRSSDRHEAIRAMTGLVLDPYFSATKMEWLLASGTLDRANELALGTVDSWILWNLTGTFATELSNASRTMLCDIDAGAWSPELCSIFGVPPESLAPIKASCGRFAAVTNPAVASLKGVAVSGILGDQQAALFGQACFSPGMVKATYGTGAFVMANAGTTRPAPTEGLLTTVAWADEDEVTFALEGSAFIAGAAIQWLRDELGIIEDASALEPLARTASEAGGLSFIPAFAGLGSPWWDDTATGALVGITRGSGRAELASAVIDALAFEVRAITDAMGANGAGLREIRVDGGAAVMDLLLERLADQARLRVTRPRSLERTALGVASLAGLAEGFFRSTEQLSELWQEAASFSPSDDLERCQLAYDRWLDALARSRDFQHHAQP